MSVRCRVIHHNCTSLYFITRYLRNPCDATLHSRRWVGSCSLLVSLTVGRSSVAVLHVPSDPIYRRLVPKLWSPLHYKITLFSFFVPTCSVWQVTLSRHTGVLHRITYGFNYFSLLVVLFTHCILDIKSHDVSSQTTDTQFIKLTQTLHSLTHTHTHTSRTRLTSLLDC